MWKVHLYIFSSDNSTYTLSLALFSKEIWPTFEFIAFPWWKVPSFSFSEKLNKSYLFNLEKEFFFLK